MPLAMIGLTVERGAEPLAFRFKNFWASNLCSLRSGIAFTIEPQDFFYRSRLVCRSRSLLIARNLESQARFLRRTLLALQSQVLREGKRPALLLLVELNCRRIKTITNFTGRFPAPEQATRLIVDINLRLFRCDIE